MLYPDRHNSLKIICSYSSQFATKNLYCIILNLIPAKRGANNDVNKKITPQKKWKLGLVASVFGLWAVTMLQALYSMEEQLKHNAGSIMGYLRKLFAGEAGLTKHPNKVFHQFSSLSEQAIRLDIVTYAAIDALENNEISKLSVVCKEWQAMMKENKITIYTHAICQLYSVDKKTCQRFLKETIRNAGVLRKTKGYRG